MTALQMKEIPTWKERRLGAQLVKRNIVHCSYVKGKKNQNRFIYSSKEKLRRSSTPCPEQTLRAGNIHPSVLSIRGIIMFSESGREGYILQLATFAVVVTHSVLMCQPFVAAKIGCFVSDSTWKKISHHNHLEKAQLYHVLEKRSNKDVDRCQLLHGGDGGLHISCVTNGLVEEFSKNQEWALCVSMCEPRHGGAHKASTAHHGEENLKVNAAMSRNTLIICPYCD